MAFYALLLLVGLYSTGAQEVGKNWTRSIYNYTRYAIRGANGNVLFEYDMLIPFQHAKSAVHNGVMNLTKDWRWEAGIIPYKIDPKQRCRTRFSCVFRWRAEMAIKRAIEDWENNTCIKFVKMKPTDKYRDYVYFKSNDRGICASHVGRVGGEQRVELGKFCRNKGSLLHHIGHVIGLFHENSRTDRDDSVSIQWDDIEKDKWYNYQKYEVEERRRLLNEYDTKSIMHLGSRQLDKTLFNKHIIPHAGIISEWKNLRKTDIEKVNALYKEECAKRE